MNIRGKIEGDIVPTYEHKAKEREDLMRFEHQGKDRRRHRPKYEHRGKKEKRTTVSLPNINFCFSFQRDTDMESLRIREERI